MVLYNRDEIETKKSHIELLNLYENDIGNLGNLGNISNISNLSNLSNIENISNTDNTSTEKISNNDNTSTINIANTDIANTDIANTEITNKHNEYVYKSYDPRGLSGLYNIGNTCYMNAVIQCLFATDSLNYYLKNDLFEKDLRNNVIKIQINKYKYLLKLNKHISESEFEKYIISKNNYITNKCVNTLTHSLRDVFKAMWEYNSIVKPHKLKNLISKYNKKFEGYSQHDSEELLYTLFDIINEETKTNIKIKNIKVTSDVYNYYNDRENLIKLINADNTNIELINSYNNFIASNYDKELIVKSIDYWKNYLNNNYSIISKLFTGLFSSELTCSECNNYNITFEPFNILELPLTKNNIVFDNIEDCIINFCDIETIEKYNCENCKKICNANKKMSIFQLPNKLIIQLKRFSTNTMIRKIDNFIKFPLTDLDMSVAQTFKPLNKKYNLYGTINHYGGTNGGHYVAHCKNILNKNWFYFNDSNVSYITDDFDVINSSAYILFYE
jgi:ubiquitin C-terminal hydrolase